MVGCEGPVAHARAFHLQDPAASDRPRSFNVKLAEWSENKEATIGRSKAVGEPPFMLGISVLEALSMAVASIADYTVCPCLDAGNARTGADGCRAAEGDVTGFMMPHSRCRFVIARMRGICAAH